MQILSRQDLLTRPQQQNSASANTKPTPDSAPGVGGCARAPAAPGALSGGALVHSAELGAAFLLQATASLKQHEIIDAETGEIIPVRRKHDCSVEVLKTPEAKRVLRYERKAAAGDVMGKRHRICACHAHPIKGVGKVEVWAKLNALLPGHFVGLQTCALSWLCAVCAPKIAERRAAEIESAMTVCLAKGGQVLMPTFTIPHGRQDPLTNTLDLIKKSRRWMGRSRQFRNLIAEFKVLGMIFATEITHGEANGWHPHFHELWFFEKAGVDVQDLENRLYALWLLACSKHGLGEPSRRHGVVVQDGSKAAQYVSKMGNSKDWKLSDEITKSSVKGGRKGSRSSWELLDCYMDSEATPQHQKRAGSLFREYAEATKGRSQLSWSPGLKKLFAVSEMTDEELCAKLEEEAVLVATITLSDWKIIRKNRLQAHVLNCAKFGTEAIRVLIDYFRRTYGKSEVTV